MTEHARFDDAEGIAALGICKSLLLALTDLKIISEKDARDLLTDVATTHHEAATASQTPREASGGGRECPTNPRWQERAAGLGQDRDQRLRRLRKAMSELMLTGTSSAWRAVIAATGSG